MAIYIGNEQQLLPTSDGRVWFEADVGINNQYSRNKQPGTRLLYSNDGLLFITTDHYKSFKEIGKWKVIIDCSLLWDEGRFLYPI